MKTAKKAKQTKEMSGGWKAKNVVGFSTTKGFSIFGQSLKGSSPSSLSGLSSSAAFSPASYRTGSPSSSGGSNDSGRGDDFIGPVLPSAPFDTISRHDVDNE